MRIGTWSRVIVGCLLLGSLGLACAPLTQRLPAEAPAADQVRPEVGRAPGAPAAREALPAPAGALPAPAPAPAIAPGAAQSAVAGKQATGFDAAQRLIVRSGTLTMLVDDVPEAAARARNLAETLGGFVVSSTQREEAGRPAATVTIRVPAERFDEALAQLRAMSVRVQNEQVNSRDVTEEFLDTDARLRNLRATEQRYLDLLAQARTVEDILKIEQQLSNVRGQIEQLQGRLEFLRRSAETSLITLELRLPAAAVTPPPPDWAVQPIFRTAVAALLATLQALAGAAIFGLVFAPLWIPVVLLIRWLRRRRGRAGLVPAGPRAPA